MPRTIGKHWPKSAPRGDYTAMCDYCGAAYRRSQLTRMRNGLFACTGPGTQNDARGRDEVELMELNARGAAERNKTPKHQGGRAQTLETYEAIPSPAELLGEPDIPADEPTNLLDTFGSLAWSLIIPDPNHITLAGNDVAVALDSSGNARNFAVAAPFRPTWEAVALASRPRITFAGAQVLSLLTQEIAAGQALTTQVLVACDVPADVEAGRALALYDNGGANPPDRRYVGVWGGGNGLEPGWSFYDNVPGIGHIGFTTPHTAGLALLESSISLVNGTRYHVNGASVREASEEYPAGCARINYLFIGSSNTGGPYVGDVYGVAVIVGEMTREQRTASRRWWSWYAHMHIDNED